MEDNNNNLEKFFRDKFNQPIEPQEWNIPDNDNWDKIAAQLSPDQRKRKFGILPFCLVGLGLVLVSVLGYDHFQKIDQIETLADALKTCGTQQNSQSASDGLVGSNNVTGRDNAKATSVIAGNEVSENTSSAVVQKDIKSSSLGLTGPALKNSVSTGQTRKKTGNELADKLNESDTEINKGSSLQIENLRAVIVPPINNIGDASTLIPSGLTSTNHTGITTVQLIDNRYITEIHTNNKTFKLDLIPPYLNIKPKVSNQLWIGPIVGYRVWQDVEKGNFNNPLEGLLIMDDSKPSMTFGFGVSKNINDHLFINSGLTYLHRNQYSKYEINLPYSTTNETAAGSEFENNFQHSLPTGLGNINTSLTLSRSSSSIVQDNENVNLDFSLQNTSKIIEIPLTVSYFVKNNKEGFYLNGGLANSWIIQNKIEEIEVVSHHALVKNKSINVDYNISQVKKYNLNIVAGVGYQKEIFNGYTASLSTNYGFALLNTYESPTYQHKINYIGAELRIVKIIE